MNNVTNKEIAPCFYNFFCQKILNIHDRFPSRTLSQILGIPLVEESCVPVMDTFKPFTEITIRQLLKTSSNAFCAVDPIPTWFIKECLDVLISRITKMVDKSLSLDNIP